MSRSGAEVLLRLGAADWVLQGPGGEARTGLDEGGPAAALDRLQAAGGLRGARLRVRLGDGWLRYLVLRWPPGVRSPVERAAYLAHRFAEVHRIDAGEWVLGADRDALELPALACAVPAAVLAGLQGFAASEGCVLAGVAGDFAGVYNALRARFDEGEGEHAALALLREGRLTVGMWRAGAWAGVRSQAVRDDGAAALCRMLEAWVRDSASAGALAAGVAEAAGARAGGVVYAAGFAGGVPAHWRRIDLELPA